MDLRELPSPDSRPESRPDLRLESAPTAATPRPTALIDRLGRRGQRAAIVFAGQGTDALAEITAVLRAEPALRDLLAPAATAVAELAHRRPFRWSGLIDRGFDPLAWITHPTTAPDAAYLTSTLISQPLILLAQAARAELCWRRGLGAAARRGGLTALTGHSQGIMAAVLVAESPDGIRPERLADHARYLAWQGLHMARSTGEITTLGEQRPMAAVTGFTLNSLVEQIDRLTADAPAEDRLHIALHNGRTRFVLSGRPAALDRLRAALDAAVTAGRAQRRAGQLNPKATPTPDRFTWEWLPVGGPFHSPHMAAGREAMTRTVADERLTFDARALRWPVLDPADASRLDRVVDLTAALIETQFLRPVRWTETVRALAADRPEVMLDLGPGDGVARLTAAALRGLGIPTLALSTAAGDTALYTIGSALDQPVCYADFAPRLAALPDGRVVLDNPYTRATGQSPVILPGMTPTTVDVPIVAAAANAGYTAELAGGGQVTAAILDRRLAELRDALRPGVAATFNALYLDRYLWDLHLGAEGRVIAAARAGLPLCGVTISAGTPPLDEAVALLDRLVSAGLWHNAFKPGTTAGVEQVLRIAAARPARPLFMHLEGGKAGGHHSWEDLEDLLLATYHRVRATPNVILCVGGGIGDPARGADFLTGRWSERHGEPAMPVDAILLGTVTMACAEATASPAVKAALVAAAGTPAWVATGAVAGGITSGKSQLDADIHYLENSAARCGRLLDAVAGDPAAIATRREEIITALAATARPYFGDIEAMTWLDATRRLIDLLAIGRGGPYEDGVWPDRSYRERVADFIRLGEARLATAPTAESVIDPALAALDDPAATLAAFALACPAAATRTVHPADARAFVGRICARPGKPVCFVPAIDADVRRWYKADALWAAQDDRYSADAVLVIPGPEAVRGIERADEPVAELLARFEAAAVEALAPAAPLPRPRRFGAHHQSRPDPIADLLAASALIEGSHRRPNPLPALCPAIPTARTTRDRDPETRLDRWVWTDTETDDRVTLTARPDGSVQLALTAPLADDHHAHYTLDLTPGPLDGPPTFHLQPDHARDALRTCYHAALFGRPLAPVALFETARETITLEADRAAAYARLTAHPEGSVPAPFAFSLAWTALFRVISCDDLASGLLRLVHLDQSVEPLAGWPLHPGETLTVEARAVDVIDRDRGRIVRAVTTLLRGDQPCARLRSGFFIRGAFADTPFRRRRHETVTLTLSLADAAALTLATETAGITFTAAPTLGDTLTLRVNLTETHPRTGPAHFTADGTVYRDATPIGHLALDLTGGTTHPLDALVQTLAAPSPATPTPRRTRATTTLRTPDPLAAFAEIGLDHNPIHQSPAFARLAGLPGPIVHGMYTAARLHAFAVREVAAGQPDRILDQRVEFTAPALPGEPLTLTATRVAHQTGHAHIEATAHAHRGDTPTLIARTHLTLRAPRTAYVFPGQGIQRRGMGMTDYARSPAARAIWDRADAVTRRHLGFSILTIVRDNPREIIVDGEALTHPEGVLHLTRFTQPAMAVLAMAQMAALREAGTAVPDAIAAGHSVGEYDALAAVFEVLPLEAVVEIVYQRGCVMHRFVPRDAHGRSAYRMGVIRPHHAGLDQQGALDLVAQIAAQTDRFIEVVNYNVRDRQYAVTGHADALDALAAALDARTTARAARAALAGRSNSAPKAAYLEVPGVDVPFHSAVLRDGVDAFRETLRTCLPAHIDPARLVGRYVPNLVAEVFTLDRAFAERIAETTRSPIIAALLADYDAHTPAILCRTLLIELLAYQFASPVRWIETQELLLRPRAAGGLGVERIIEIGVGYQPTVANMLHQTLAGLGRHAPPVEVYNAEADADLVHGRDQDPLVEPAPAPVTAVPITPTATPIATPTPTPTATPTTPLPDHPVSLPTALRTLLALQARVRPDQIDDTETLDALFEGVSSRRNQALLDLGAEFDAGSLDAAHEKPLARLAAELTPRATRYRHPGPYLRAAQDEAIRLTLGRAGFSRREATAYLEATYALGPGLTAHALDLLALETRDGASSRGGPLGSLTIPATTRAEATALLDQLIDRVAQHLNRPIPRAGANTTTPGGTVDAAAVTALADHITGPTGLLATTARDLLHRLGATPAPVTPTPDQAPALRARIDAEHGPGYLDQIAPRFDARRHLALTETLPFARRDLARLHADATNHRPHDASALNARLALFAPDPTFAATARWYAVRSAAPLAATFDRIARGQGTGPATVRPTRPMLSPSTLGPRYTEIPDPQSPDLPTFITHLADAVTAPPAIRDAWTTGSTTPLDLRNRTALITGASPGSIAYETTRHLLRGGARVILTTTTDTRARRRTYRDLFHTEAAPGAELHIVPCNMASMTDIDALADWLFAPLTEQAGATVRVLKRPFAPDLLLPFAALADAATLDRLDTRAHLTFRAMLLGVERLITALATRHRAHGLPADRCHVILPLSPNHGAFGGDGLYAETKAALEVLTAKWHSEHDTWGHATTLCAARIGWVRGTGLMDHNNPIAARLEATTPVRTFSAPEMGFLIAGLCTTPARRAAAETPLRVDLTGHFDRIPDLRATVTHLRATLEAETHQARRTATLAATYRTARGTEPTPPVTITCKPNWPAPEATPETTLEPAPHPWPAPITTPLDRMIVIVGRGEIGPCGSDRTRFELEVDDALSPASVLELAWTCGLIRWTPDPRGGAFTDTATGDPVPEDSIFARYHDAVRHRTGIRLINPATTGYDPAALPVHATVYLDRDFTFPVASQTEAQAFAAADPTRTTITHDPATDTWKVTRTAGAEVKVLRQARLAARVAGVIPDGFDFTRHGIPAEMVERVDPVALYNLIATVDAFLSAGLTPEDLLTHIHPARVANTQGAGIGGMASLRRLYQDHLLGVTRQGDVLQETLINVAAAYVVQGYIGSYGAMSHPVGACATAAVSLEEGIDKILAGRADFVVAGGFDDIGPEGAIGFADMGATADTDALLAMGLEPTEFSRANDTRRRGFVEAQGGGTVLLTRADIARDLALPVYGVLAYAGTFGDGIQQSIPAPGLGALAAALGGQHSPLGRALATHGLAADDIALVYKHDTSTTANDHNENALHHRIQAALGRTPGNPLFAVSQKTLTGHAKGGAAAWQLNGLCQALTTGVIPGNRNLEEVDPAMAPYTHLAFTDHTLRPAPATPLRAGLLTSLGFGHVSAVALVLHPDAFLAALSPAQATDWQARVATRATTTTRRRAAILMGDTPAYHKRTHRRFLAPDGTPAQATEEAHLLLDPTTRFDPTRGRYTREGDLP